MSPHIANGVMLGGPAAELHAQKHQSKHTDDAGIDLYPCAIGKVQRFDLTGMLQLFIMTGVCMVFPPRTYGRITGRSSTQGKLHGAARVEDGVIDAGYSGELMVRLVLHHTHEEHVRNLLGAMIQGQVAIAQVIPTVIFAPHWMPWDEATIASLGRGANGFGSTDRIQESSNESIAALEASLVEPLALDIPKVLVEPRTKRGHLLFTTATCTCRKDTDDQCNVCDGGLSVCRVCSAGEIELDQFDCPMPKAADLIDSIMMLVGNCHNPEGYKRWLQEQTMGLLAQEHNRFLAMKHNA